MAEEESVNQNERKIAHTVSKLPHLEDGYMRVVHITTPGNAKGIKGSGLDYGKYGMAMSMAVAWSNEEEVVFGSDDPRFNYPGLKVVVMDMPAETMSNFYFLFIRH